MTDEEKRKFEIIKSILEDLKEISKSQNIDKNVKVSSGHCYGVTVFGSKTTENVVINGEVAVTGSAPAVSGNGSAGYGNTNIVVNGTVSADKANAIACLVVNVLACFSSAKVLYIPLKNSSNER